MTPLTPEQKRDGALLAAALKAIRRHRGLRALDVATRMNLSLRTYENFESGRIRINADYIHRFCAATDSDTSSTARTSCPFERKVTDRPWMSIIAIAGPPAAGQAISSKKSQRSL